MHIARADNFHASAYTGNAELHRPDIIDSLLGDPDSLPIKSPGITGR
jgi:hypothetical protein